MRWPWQRRHVTFVNARVLGDGARIASSVRVSGDCIDDVDGAPSRGDLVVDLEGAIVVPGLVNAHDHLELNSFPRLKWRDRYENASEWIADFQPRFGRDPDLAAACPETLDDRAWVGGLKNLFAGVTTVCHHNPMHPVLLRRFPVRVVQRFRMSHSLLIDGSQVADDYRRTPADCPWIIHAAEGTDAAAAREIDTLDGSGCLGPNTVLVHGVAIEPERMRRLAARGISLVWCPTSNLFLFGATPDVRAFDDEGRLALGSDSRLSGEGDLLDEMRAAYATRQLSAEGILRTVTTGAAAVLRIDTAGRLCPGAPADLAVVRANGDDPYESLASATRLDVKLVMIGGRSRVAEPAFRPLFAHLGIPETPATLDGAPRLVAQWIARRARRLRMPEPGLEVAPC